MKKYIPPKKKDSHLILVDYGNDQFIIETTDSSGDVTYTPLHSFLNLLLFSKIYINTRKKSKKHHHNKTHY